MWNFRLFAKAKYLSNADISFSQTATLPSTATFCHIVLDTVSKCKKGVKHECSLKCSQWIYKEFWCRCKTTGHRKGQEGFFGTHVNEPAVYSCLIYVKEPSHLMGTVLLLMLLAQSKFACYNMGWWVTQAHSGNYIFDHLRISSHFPIMKNEILKKYVRSNLDFIFWYSEYFPKFACNDMLGQGSFGTCPFATVCCALCICNCVPCACAQIKLKTFTPNV